MELSHSQGFVQRVLLGRPALRTDLRRSGARILSILNAVVAGVGKSWLQHLRHYARSAFVRLSRQFSSNLPRRGCGCASSWQRRTRTMFTCTTGACGIHTLGAAVTRKAEGRESQGLVGGDRVEKNQRAFCGRSWLWSAARTKVAQPYSWPHDSSPHLHAWLASLSAILRPASGYELRCSRRGRQRFRTQQSAPLPLQQWT